MKTEESVIEKRYLLIDKLCRTDRHNVFYGCEAQLSDDSFNWEAIENPVAFAIKKSYLLGQHHRLIKEANTIAQIVHPNVVNYIDHSEHKHDPYIVMEYVPEILDNLVRRNELNQQHITSYISQICDVLDLFNKLNIAHCDLSPTNIGFNQDTLKVFDFDNTVVCYRETNASPEKFSTFKTPEALKGIVTPSSDTYCAGRVLDYMINGKESESVEEAIERMQHKQRRLPDSFLTLYKAMVNDDYFERPTGSLLKMLVKRTLDDFRIYQPMNMVLES